MVLPAKGEIMEAMYLESLQEGDPMHETMGLSGMDCLWILGIPYNLGDCDPDGLMLLQMLLVISLLFCNALSLQLSFASYAFVGSLGSGIIEQLPDLPVVVLLLHYHCCILLVRWQDDVILPLARDVMYPQFCGLRLRRLQKHIKRSAKLHP